MMEFNSMEELVLLSEQAGKTISAIVLSCEVESSRRSEAAIMKEMRSNWRVMCDAVKRGICSSEKSASKMTGGDAKKLYSFENTGASYSGSALRAASYAIAVSEVNASMGCIVACPTAGSCGILPAALTAAAEMRSYKETEIVRALFTAAGVGAVIAQNASISGAEGGCQAECGSAAAMAAASLTELAGGSPKKICQAVALALKNMLGLVCDPVAGLVEIPCVKRNGFAASYALLAADMALAGVESAIPADEVIDAMRRIGAAMPKAFRETSEGGLAVTPTARRIAAELYGIAHNGHSN